MPLAIPVRIDFDEEITWVDMEEAYYASRVLRLYGVLDSRIADFFSTSIDHFNIEDEEERIQLWIHCRGGRVDPSVVNLYDTMQESEAPLQTFCVGKSAAAATLLLMGGKKGVRVGFPISKIGIHLPEICIPRKKKRGLTQRRPLPKPSVSTKRVSSDLEYDAAIRERITRLYALRTGTPFSVIFNDMEKGLWMTAAQAKAYGIIDRIGLGKQ